MRPIDADALINEIKKETEKAIEQDDKVGSFWIGYIAGLVIKQPTIQPVATDTNVGDTISRQWLMECVNEGWIKFDTEKDENRFIHLVRDIAPTIQPEPHEGTWVYGEDSTTDCVDGYRCSQCGFFVPWDYNHKLIDYINDYAYCPNCGAKMITK